MGIDLHLIVDNSGRAARALREDAGFVPQYVYAAKLASEICQPGRTAVFHYAVIGRPFAIHFV